MSRKKSCVSIYTIKRLFLFMYSQKYALSQITHVLILISQMVHEHWKDHTIEATLILCHKTEMEKKSHCICIWLYALVLSCGICIIMKLRSVCVPNKTVNNAYTLTYIYIRVLLCCCGQHCLFWTTSLSAIQLKGTVCIPHIFDECPHCMSHSIVNLTAQAAKHKHWRKPNSCAM